MDAMRTEGWGCIEVGVKGVRLKNIESHWDLIKRLGKKITAFGEYHNSKNLKASLAHSFFVIMCTLS